MKQLYILVLCCLTTWGLLAQEIDIRVTVDSSLIVIGDQVRVNLAVEVPIGSTIEFPNLVAAFENDQLELIDESAVEEGRTEAGNALFEQSLTITAWDEGMYAIPALSFSYRIGEQTGEQKSDIVMLEAQYPPTVTGDSTFVADIKPILEEPYTFWDYFVAIFKHPATWVILILLILGAAYWAYRQWNERIIPLPSPEEVAQDRMEALEANNPLDQGDFREFHTQVSFIIREYLSNRFRVGALKRPTSEFLPELTTKQLDTLVYQELKEVLERADLIKFAKASPLDIANKQARDFVYKLIEHVLGKLTQAEEEKEEVTEVQ